MTSVQNISSFDYTKTGVLGAKRDTMLVNELQLKPELGRSLRRGYTIPDGFTFGRPNRGMPGGAGEALRGWSNYHTGEMEGSRAAQQVPEGMMAEESKLPFLRSSTQQPRDFMALNKAAISAGLVKSNEQYQFRATHDIRQKVKEEKSQRGKQRRLPASMVYGLATRPSTPIYDLIEHKYQDKWLNERRSHELSRRQHEDTQKQSNKEIYHTRASMLRTFMEPVPQQPLWKMSKFERRAKPNLETFRSTNQRESAYKYHDCDGVPRRGDFNEGIPEPARS